MLPVDWEKLQRCLSIALQAVGVTEPGFDLTQDEHDQVLEIKDSALSLRWNAEDGLWICVTTYNPGVYRYPDGSGEPPSVDVSDLRPIVPKVMPTLEYGGRQFYDYSEIAVDVAVEAAKERIDWAFDRAAEEEQYQAWKREQEERVE